MSEETRPSPHSTSPSLPLHTDRLTLRLHRPDDAPRLHQIYAQPEVARFLLDDPWTAQDAERHVTERLAKTGLDSDSHALALVIEHAGEVIGDVALWLTQTEHRIAEIGWVLAPSHGGQGFAREAISAVLRSAFTEFRVHRVAAQMDARNTASAKLAAAVGMTREAHLRQDWWSKGEWTDTVIYAALASDVFI